MENNGIFSGLDFFLKNKNEGLIDERSLNEPEKKQEEEKQEEDNLEGKEEKKEEFKGLTLEEIEAGMKDQSSEKDEDDSSEKEESQDQEEKEEGGKKEEEKSGEESDDFWKDLSSLLKEKGIVEEDFDNPDKMIEVFGKEVERGVEDWIESLPNEVKDIVEAAANGLNGQSLKSFIDSKDNQIQLESIDDKDIKEDVSLAKSIVRAHLQSTTKMSVEKIEKHISRLEDLDELTDEALDAKSSLIEFEKEEREAIKARNEEIKKQNEQKHLETVKQIQKTVTETKEIIPGIKLSEKEQKELHKMITTPVELRGNTPVSAAMKLREQNPIDFEMKLNYFILKGFFDGNFDEVVKKAQGKAVSKIESSIEASAKKLLAKTTSKTREEQDPNVKPNILTSWQNRKK